MSSLPTLPQTSWLRRLSVAASGALLGLGVAVLSGWIFAPGAFALRTTDEASIGTGTAASMVIFGLALLAIEFGYRALAWACLLPTVLAAVSLAETWSGQPLGLERILALASGLRAGQPIFQTPAVISACFLAAGLAILWIRINRGNRLRNPALALVGSVMIAIGFSTVLGYALRLPTVYNWSTPTLTAPLSANALLIFGAALMLLAWRETGRVQPGAPTWLPLPVVVASATLTVIFWIGLRGREIEYSSTNTEIQLNSFASTISLELDRELSAFERMAQRWSQDADLTPTVREVDATTHLNDSPACQSIAWLDAEGRTLWLYPVRGNEIALSLDHRSDPIRAEALQAARRANAAVMSGSLNLHGQGPGFVIYAPVATAGRLQGHVAAEYSYRRFFAMIDQRTRTNSNYHASITIGASRVYETPGFLQHESNQVIDKNFAIRGLRLRIAFSPTEEYLRRNRRFLPELALTSGFGITLLLGLSVHLARAAHTGLRAAETSNKRLVAENEERRRIEAMLKISDERLRLALDSTQIGIFEWQLASRQIYYSPGVWTMLGYDPAKQPLNPDVWQSLIHPEDVPRFREISEIQLAGEKSFIDPEYRVRGADGSWRWVYVRSRSFTSNGRPGSPTRVIGTIQDITERKQAEQALRESQAATRKLSLVASRTDNLVIIASREGRIEWVNESFERVMEYSLSEVVGRNPETFMIGPDTSLHTLRRLKVALGRGEGITTDIVNYSKSGRKYHLHLEIQPVRSEDGVLENFIAIQADITARVETETALRRAKTEADEASRAKSDFLASMSHEIRTPMNGVIGMTSLLLETPLNVEQRDFVNTIRNSGEALLTIINDILDFSKIESGKMDLESHPFELSVCLEEALDLFAVSAASKKVELVYCIDEGIPDWINGDVTRLRQVLVNLVNNAVKFTPSGSVSVFVRALRPSAESLNASERFLLEFAIRDTGIGIPPDRVDRLFKPFSQVDSSTTRKYGGTGLGLAICHRLTVLMGGNIRVESVAGQGSAFIFTVQASAAPAPLDHARTPLPETLRGRPVLCVEDHPLLSRRLEITFRRLGAQPQPALTVSDALRLLEREPPAAVVLDLAMTESEEGNRLRDRIAELHLPTVIVLPPGQTAVTAFGERRLLATTHKPLKTQPLIRALRHLAQVRMAEDPSVPTSTAPAAGEPTLAQSIPLRLLLVEDNPVNQKVATRFLSRLGYRADIVGNGLEAVKAVEASQYDLVLMDLQMPEMDGFEACRQIRRRLQGRSQPRIVALTANALQGDRELCLAAGMDDYITKPVKLADISAVIQRQFVKNAPHGSGGMS